MDFRQAFEDLNLSGSTVSPCMTTTHRQKRLDFALANVNRDWGNVLFSDELVFRNYIRSDDGNIDRNITVFWGWIGRSGPGNLAVISGLLNSDKYIKLLEDTLIPSIDDFSSIALMQDNSPPHASQKTAMWFSNYPQIELLVAPPNSPDVNPICNLWAEITRSTVPGNSAISESDIVQKWEALRGKPQYFEIIYESMNARMLEVIRKNGGLTAN